MTALRTILDFLPNYEYVLVRQDAPIHELKDIVRKHPGVRTIYITDNEGRVVGEVSIGALIKAATALRRCRGGLSARELLSCLSCKKAGDIVDRRLVYATADEDVEKVLDRCLKYNIKELPVLDEKKRVIKNIGVLDLLAQLEKEDDLSKSLKKA